MMSDVPQETALSPLVGRADQLRRIAGLVGVGDEPGGAVLLGGTRASAKVAARQEAQPLLTELRALGAQAAPSARTPTTRYDEPLTAREDEVLALVAEGGSNRQIAGALFISAKTVSVHVSNILAKLGAAGRTEAAAIARRQGLLTASSTGSSTGSDTGRDTPVA